MTLVLVLVLSKDRVEKTKGLMGEVELVVSARVVSWEGERSYDGIYGSVRERAMKRWITRGRVGK